jgi:hypothetical protein
MNNSAFLPWVVSHLQYIGWPTLIFTCYKLLRFIFKTGTLATVFIQRVLKAEDTITLMSVNHLPHIEQAVNKSNELLVDIREELRLVRVVKDNA